MKEIHTMEESIFKLLIAWSQYVKVSESRGEVRSKEMFSAISEYKTEEWLHKTKQVQWNWTLKQGKLLCQKWHDLEHGGDIHKEGVIWDELSPYIQGDQEGMKKVREYLEAIAREYDAQEVALNWRPNERRVEISADGKVIQTKTIKAWWDSKIFMSKERRRIEALGKKRQWDPLLHSSSSYITKGERKSSQWVNEVEKIEEKFKRGNIEDVINWMSKRLVELSYSWTWNDEPIKKEGWSGLMWLEWMLKENQKTDPELKNWKKIVRGMNKGVIAHWLDKTYDFRIKDRFGLNERWESEGWNHVFSVRMMEMGDHDSLGGGKAMERTLGWDHGNFREWADVWLEVLKKESEPGHGRTEKSEQEAKKVAIDFKNAVACETLRRMLLGSEKSLDSWTIDWFSVIDSVKEHGLERLGLTKIIHWSPYENRPGTVILAMNGVWEAQWKWVMNNPGKASMDLTRNLRDQWRAKKEDFELKAALAEKIRFKKDWSENEMSKKGLRL